MTLRTGFMVAAAALIAVTSAQISQSGSTYSMKMKWAKGKTYNYGITYTYKVGAQSTPMKGSYSLAVKEVNNGVATITAKANVPMLSNGEAQTLKVDSYGNVKSGDTNMNMTSLPAKPVKVGEKWSSTRKITQPLPMNMKSTYVFKGLKTVSGKKYAEIAETMSGSSGNLSTTGTGTMLYDVTDGMLYKYSTSMKMVMKSEKDSQTIPITSVILRTK